MFLKSAVACLSLFVSSVLIGGCATSPEQIHSSTCNDASTSVPCLLKMADTTLATVEGNFDWATAANELAIAHDAAGNSDAAWALMSQALARAQQIADSKKRATALGEIALALPKMQSTAQATPLIDRLASMVSTVDDAGKRADILGKTLTARSVHGNASQAAALALQMPRGSETEDAFRGRTQREIAAQLAAQGDFDTAQSVIKQITAGFTYYGAVARTDVAREAVRAEQRDVVASLLAQAVQIGREQENGYFEAGILRDVGKVYYQLDDHAAAEQFITAARAAAQQAPKFQERARATSRIATSLADVGRLQQTVQIIEQALALARQESSPLMRNYSMYEIAGSAAFGGHFSTARALIDELPDTPFGSASSLKGAAQRDLAWGQVRHGDVGGGLRTARAIAAPRERVHALSRMVRLLRSPDMAALPRYL